MNPSSIAGVIIILLLLVVAVFGFFSIVEEGDITANYEKDFLVIDPTQNQSLYVMGALDNVIVEQILSDGTIVFVDPLEWDYDLLYITVNHTVLI